LTWLFFYDHQLSYQLFVPVLHPCRTPVLVTTFFL
jgi:hypothetical protein